jgi:hypothetical protein
MHFEKHLKMKGKGNDVIMTLNWREGSSPTFFFLVPVPAGFLISFGIRCNLGVAIVQMTANNTETGVKKMTTTKSIVK